MKLLCSILLALLSLGGGEALSAETAPAELAAHATETASLKADVQRLTAALAATPDSIRLLSQRGDALLFQLTQKPQQVLGVFVVERSGWLVEDEQPRAGRQRTREAFISHEQALARAAQVEVDLRASEGLFMGLFRSNPAATLVQRLPSGEVIDVNDAFTRITGYAPHEVLGRFSSILEGPLTDKDDLALLARTLQEGREVSLTLKNYRKDGSLFHNKLSVSPVRDARGEITHYINVIEDVSSQVEVKQRLIERTARLNATFDLSPDGFVVFDEKGQVVFVNRAFTPGYAGGDAPGLAFETAYWIRQHDIAAICVLQDSSSRCRKTFPPGLQVKVTLASSRSSSCWPDPAMVAFLPVALIGPLCYAVEGLYVARYGTAQMDPVQAMFGASVMGLVLCLPIALLSGQMYNPFADFGRDEVALIGSSAIHALMYAGYVWLAFRAGAVFASQCSYIVTGAGIFWAMALLGERFPPSLWLALVLLLCGVALVSPRERVAKAEGPTT